MANKRTTDKRRPVSVTFNDRERMVAEKLANALGFADFSKFIRFAVWQLSAVMANAAWTKSLVEFAWNFRAVEATNKSVLAPMEVKDGKKS